MCVHNKELKQYVVASGGWEFKDEARPGQRQKLGFVATQPGSTLKIKISTVMPGKPKDGSVTILLAFLKSYSQMGIARISCVHGCSCTGHDLDANHTAKESTTHLHRVVTTQHLDCTIAITVSNRTNSIPPNHKFKISGVMMSDETTGYVMHDGSWWAGQHHEATRNLKHHHRKPTLPHRKRLAQLGT